MEVSTVRTVTLHYPSPFFQFFFFEKGTGILSSSEWAGLNACRGSCSVRIRILTKTPKNYLRNSKVEKSFIDTRTISCKLISMVTYGNRF